MKSSSEMLQKLPIPFVISCYLIFPLMNPLVYHSNLENVLIEKKSKGN